MTLDEWEIQYRNCVPLLRVFLFASEADVVAAAQAWTKTRPKAPDALPVPPKPGPVWVKRPNYVLSTTSIEVEEIRGEGVAIILDRQSPFRGNQINFGKSGKHVNRTLGRHKKHGRLDTKATIAALDAWRTNRFAQEALFRAHIRRVEDECRVEAIRGGKGWILGKRKGGYDTQYFIFSPERNLWSVEGAWQRTFIPRSEIVEVIEETEASAACPMMTLEEIQATLISLGCDAIISKSGGFAEAQLSVDWNGVHVSSLFLRRDDPLVCLREGKQGFEHTPDGVKAWLAASVASARKRLEEKIKEAAENLTKLSTFGESK